MLLDVHNLQTSFHTRAGIVRAVDRVSFTVEKGQTVGIVGESGSGKSVCCYSLLGLIPQPPGKIEGGSAKFDGQDLLALEEAELQRIRGSRIAMIFQDPMTSLNPYMRISAQLTEPLLVHEDMGKDEALDRATQALADVGIPSPEKRIHSYPHEFSGGMRQRVMIAMALITKPELLIADEPTTALDVTIQKQVLDLLRERREEAGAACIFITHDLALVSGFCDVVNVMYAGRIVEHAPAAQLFSNPRHAYTRALLASLPSARSRGETLHTIPGTPPNLTATKGGCAFAPRSGLDHDPHLLTKRAPFQEIAPGHFVEACPACT